MLVLTPVSALVVALALSGPASDAAPPSPLPEGGGDAKWSCVGCHSEGVAGHTPPAAMGCLACHVEADGAGPSSPTAKGGSDHLLLVPPGRETCLECHDDVMGEGRRYPHEPAAEGPCTTCHDPHDARAKGPHLVARFGDQVCAPCHGDQGRGKRPHTAVRRGQCASCHEVHGSDQPALLSAESAAETCRSCHADMWVGSAAGGHLPSATGHCTACHDPHGSDVDNGLVQPVPDLCYGCHEPKDGGSQVHSAVRLGRCTECHDPHGSPNPRKLREARVDQVCFRCHADDITGRAVVHAPVGAGQCVICHDPHTTDNPKNLRNPPDLTCVMCHPDKDRPDAKSPHGAVRAYGCTQCHDPHAGDYEFRLRKPVVQLCTTCHEGFDDGYHVAQRPYGGGHPIGTADDPRNPGRKVVCTSCHDPHGNDNPRMWWNARTRIELCAECHKSLAPAAAPAGQGDTR